MCPLSCRRYRRLDEDGTYQVSREQDIRRIIIAFTNPSDTEFKQGVDAQFLLSAKFLDADIDGSASWEMTVNKTMVNPNSASFSSSSPILLIFLLDYQLHLRYRRNLKAGL